MTTVISSPRGGLGGRLLGIACGMQFAEIYGLDFMVWWVTANDCCHASALFNQNPQVREQQTLFGLLGEEIRSGYCSILSVGSLMSPPSQDKVASFKDYDYILHKRGMFGTFPDFKGKMRTILDFLQPLPYITDEVDEFCEKNDVANSVALHVRRGQLSYIPHMTQHEIHINRLIRTSTYIEKIEELGYENERIILSTECNLAEIEMKIQFKNVVRIPCRNHNLKTRIAIQDSLKTIMIMSRAKALVTGPSAFSQSAALIGQGHCEYHLIPKENNLCLLTKNK